MVTFERKLFSATRHTYTSVNRCIWANENPQGTIKKPIHSQSVTIWCSLWVGGAIGSYFFENEVGQAVTVNGVRYRKIITNFLLLEMKDMEMDDIYGSSRMALLRKKFNVSDTIGHLSLGISERKLVCQEAKNNSRVKG